MSHIKNVLVTGGTGFLGLHICNRLSELGFNVTAYDIHSFKSSDDVQDIEFVQADVRDTKILNQSMTGVDVVIHAASAIPTWSEEEIHNAIVDGTRSVLVCAIEQNVDQIVHVSSAAVYGRRDHHPITENSPLKPRSTYGIAKKQAESLCREQRSSDLRVSILRPQAIIGPQRLGVFEILFDWIESGASVPVIGSGENEYQLLHVQDMVRAIELLMTTSKGNIQNETYNVGTDRYQSIKEDFQALLHYAGAGKRVVGTPASLAIWSLRLLTRLNLSPLYPSLYETATEDTSINVKKIESIGWKPEFSNQEALIDTYHWYEQNFSKDDGGAIGNRSAHNQKALKIIKRIFMVL